MCWKKSRLNDVKFSEDKDSVKFIDFHSMFPKISIDDMETIKKYVYDLLEDKLIDSYKLKDMIYVFREAYRDGDYLEEDKEITDYILDTHNNKFDYDNLYEEKSDNIVEIDIKQEVIDKIDIRDAKEKAENILEKSYGLVLDRASILLIFYIQVIELYKNNNLG